METLRIGPGVPTPPRSPRWRVLLAELRTIVADTLINIALGTSVAAAVLVALRLAQ